MAGEEPSGYRHSRHAGNFADVHKHALLAWITDRLVSAGGPLCILDTHAGDGLYRPEAGRQHLLTRLRADDGPPSALDPYRRALASAVCTGGEGAYPGSPYLLRTLMGADDRLLLADTHPIALGALRNRFGDDPRVTILDVDGWSALGQWRTDGCARGLVLVDPPYDSDRDYRLAAEAVISAARRGPGVCLCLWFPVTDGPHEVMLDTLRSAFPGCCGLHAHLRAPPSPSGGMRGSGLFVVHPPAGLEVAVSEIGTRLRMSWACGSGGEGAAPS